MDSQFNVHATAKKALGELGLVFDLLKPEMVQLMCDEILTARRIACYAAGREGLMHLGLDVHMVGDMTTPPIGAGDLLIVSTGPGECSTGMALMGVARRSGAHTLVVTAQQSGAVPQLADVIIHLPAQTMANDSGEDVSLLPMGSLFEAAELLFFDLISMRLRDLSSQTPEQMRARHTNLE